MPELEDDGPGRTRRDRPSAPPPDAAAAAAPGESIMDLDLDVYSPWPTMDQQLPFGAFLSASDQPSSPLWALSRGFEDKLAAAPRRRRRGPPLRLLSVRRMSVLSSSEFVRFWFRVGFVRIALIELDLGR
ncbi:hypothetical protein ACJRO7_019836 [Eucalyptus globulus]|uniref:Uncharacterized protein n=1 Tax=Eucalyptus globulus TaxID=34317 RepID=A0ABD3KJS9_EUCGL